MWFEDIPLGVKITLGSYTFTEENIIAFGKRYDPQPFHVDKEAALRSAYGGLIASGWHTAAVWMKLMMAHRARAHRRGRRGDAGELCLAGRARAALAEAGTAGNDADLHERAVRQARLADAAAIRPARRKERSARRSGRAVLQLHQPRADRAQALTHRRFDVAAVDGDDGRRRLAGERQEHEGVGHILGGDFAARADCRSCSRPRKCPRALARAATMSSVSRPVRMRSALTALERMPSLPWSSAYCLTRNRVAAFGKP